MRILSYAISQPKAKEADLDTDFFQAVKRETRDEVDDGEGSTSRSSGAGNSRPKRVRKSAAERRVTCSRNAAVGSVGEEAVRGLSQSLLKSRTPGVLVQVPTIHTRKPARHGARMRGANFPGPRCRKASIPRNENRHVRVVPAESC